MSTGARQALVGTLVTPARQALVRAVHAAAWKALVGMSTTAGEALVGTMRIKEMHVVKVAGVSDLVDRCHRHGEWSFG